MNDPARPDGIEPHHIHEAHGSLHVRWPFNLAGLGLLLSLAFVGVFGAGARIVSKGGDASLVVEGPVRIRNGNFYETQLTVGSGRDIQDLVIRVDKDIWYEVTVNTILPEPSEYGFHDGSFVLHFGKLAAGESLVVKFSAQINSGRRPSTNAGKIAVADGDTILAAVDYAMEVLP